MYEFFSGCVSHMAHREIPCLQNHKVFELLASYLPGAIPWDWGGK